MGGDALNGMIMLVPGESAAAGDVYVNTGVLKGAAIFSVKVAPWFAANAAAGTPQGGFVAAIDSASGYTRVILADEHYLSAVCYDNLAANFLGFAKLASIMPWLK